MIAGATGLPMLLIVSRLVPELVIVMACIALDAPTVVFGKAPDPLKVTAGPVGVTLLDGADGALTPATLVAVTVKVYGIPGVSPETMIGPPVVTPVIPPGLDVAVYVEIGLPPSKAGGV